MTDRRDMELFETRFCRAGPCLHGSRGRAPHRRSGGLAYGDVVPARDRLVAAAARPRASPARGIAGARLAVALVAVVVIGVAGIAILGRPSEAKMGPQPTLSPAPSTSGPVPDALRHSWERPYAVTPDLDQWPTGFLNLASDLMDFGPAPGDAASKSMVAAGEPDVLVATATVDTQGCAIGDTGAYRWSLEGKGTILTLTAISADACAARQDALAGPWVRTDLPPLGDGVTLLAGTYETKAFDPFGKPSLSSRLSSTVPAGWKVKVDDAATLLLHRLPDASSTKPSTDLFVSIFVAQVGRGGRGRGDLRAGWRRAQRWDRDRWHRGSDRRSTRRRIDVTDRGNHRRLRGPDARCSTRAGLDQWLQVAGRADRRHADPRPSGVRSGPLGSQPRSSVATDPA